MATQEKSKVRRSFHPRLQEKRWDHHVERTLFETWYRRGTFRFSPRVKRRIFVIDTPPPTTSGKWHIGAVASYSQIDMIARSQRMRGNNVLFPIGFDRNGINVEIFVEKNSNVKMRDTPREQFIELCNMALDQLEAQMIEIMRRVGLSGDYDNKYHTDAESYRKFTQATFIDLWKRGLVYEATRPNNYCHDCGTTIADAEVEYEELPSNLTYIEFKVRETGEPLIIATTRPELLCACQLVVVNPTDQRYMRLHGLHVVLPLYLREVEIRPHPSVKEEFGTGAVMICSYGDYNDVLLFRELGLSEVLAVGPDGKLTGAAGQFQGLSVREGRSRIIEELATEGFLKKTEKILHRTPICSRSNTPIEIIPMKEYYLKQLEFVPKLRSLSKGVVFHPATSRQILSDWLNSVSIDWPISRRRIYSTEIPVWYCKKCGKPLIPAPGPYYRPWRDPPPAASCEKCGYDEFEGETRTFDTWVDSSVSALYVTKYPTDLRFFKRSYPANIRPQGKDIVRTWLHYSMLRCYQLTGRAPFRNVWINGLGMDEQGQAMHKSKGNVVEPEPLLEKYGADAFRFWNASEATLGSDFRCSEMRIAGAHKFVTKLWNMSRFISSFPQPKAAHLQPSDKWILSELSLLVEKSMKGYVDFNFFIPATSIRDFVWETFASHYLEMVKPRAYGEGFTRAQQGAAWYTLHTVLKTILILLAPIAPFISEHVWTQLYSKKTIHNQNFPRSVWPRQSKRHTSKIVEFNREVWKLKKDRNLTLRDPIDMKIPKALTPFATDLRKMHYITSK